MIIFKLMALANTIAMIGGAYIVFSIVGLVIVDIAHAIHSAVKRITSGRNRGRKSKSPRCNSARRTK